MTFRLFEFLVVCKSSEGVGYVRELPGDGHEKLVDG